MNALQKGEVDIIESLGFDHYETVKADTALADPEVLELRAAVHGAASTTCTSRSTTPKVRQAALAAFAQEPFLRAQVGVKELYKPCASMFICGTPYGSDRRQRHPGEVEHEEGAGPAQGLGLRRHADRADEADRPRRDPEAAGRRRAAAAPGRLQGRPAGDGLADAGRPARQEGPAGQGRLAHVPHRLADATTSGARSPTRRWTRAARSRAGSAGPRTPR